MTYKERLIKNAWRLTFLAITLVILWMLALDLHDGKFDERLEAYALLGLIWIGFLGYIAIQYWHAGSNEEKED